MKVAGDGAVLVLQNHPVSTLGGRIPIAAEVLVQVIRRMELFDQDESLFARSGGQAFVERHDLQ